ncbi:TlpA disulfide reductase family protein [Flaviaesturariibacter flavus]|nr:TlpA disulfide reductase family protein [Flaviaesturariibacter flavus]
MNRTLLPAALLFLVAACKHKENNNFTVDGTLKGGAGQTVYLLEAKMDARVPVIVDSAKADANGRFSLEGSRLEENLYLLRSQGNEAPFAKVVNDAPQITVSASTSGTPSYAVKGSAASVALQVYTDTINSKLPLMEALIGQGDSLRNASVSDSTLAPLRGRAQGVANEFRNYTLQLVKNSPSPTVAVYALGTYLQLARGTRLGLPDLSNDELLQLVNATAARFGEHKGLAQLRASVEGEVKKGSTEPAAAGASALLNKPAPELALNDSTGKPVPVSSFRGKWLLIDFWASWCRPCRLENPNVVAAFNKFRNRNFTILGVSLDEEKGAWTKAIRQDGLTWTHVSDLAFWNSKAVSTYGFNSIPFNVLVDPSGTVVATDLRGPALEQKLAEVLK